MNRTFGRTAVLLAVTGLSCLPGIAAADAPGTTRTIVIGDNNQVAGDDIFNAGRDNTVGSNDGSGPGLGVVPSVGQAVLIRNVAQGDAMLESSTGPATFLGRVPANTQFPVAYSGRSTATYRTEAGQYELTLDHTADGRAVADCAPSEHCRVAQEVYGLVIDLQ